MPWKLILLRLAVKLAVYLFFPALLVTFFIGVFTVQKQVRETQALNHRVQKLESQLAAPLLIPLPGK